MSQASDNKINSQSSSVTIGSRKSVSHSESYGPTWKVPLAN